MTQLYQDILGRRCKVRGTSTDFIYKVVGVFISGQTIMQLKCALLADGGGTAEEYYINLQFEPAAVKGA